MWKYKEKFGHVQVTDRIPSVNYLYTTYLSTYLNLKSLDLLNKIKLVIVHLLFVSLTILFLT